MSTILQTLLLAQRSSGIQEITSNGRSIRVNLPSRKASGDDGSGGSDPVEPTLPVDPGPLPPSPLDFIMDGKEDSATSFDAEDFKTIDGAQAARIEIKSLPANGKLTIGTDGVVKVGNSFVPDDLDTMVYTPDANFASKDSFT